QAWESGVATVVRTAGSCHDDPSYQYVKAFQVASRERPMDSFSDSASACHDQGRGETEEKPSADDEGYVKSNCTSFSSSFLPAARERIYFSHQRESEGYS